MNDRQTLASEIKFSFKSANIPLIIFGSIFISLMGHFMVLGHNPELLNDPLEIHLIFVFVMAFFIGLSLSVALVFLGASLYYKPRVLRYVDVPKNIDEVRDQMITIASLITIDFPDNLKKIGNFFSYLNQQLNEFRTHLEKHDDQMKNFNETKVDKSELKKVENTVNELKNNYDTLYRFTGKQGQHVFALHWILQRTLRDNSKLVKENNELKKEKIQTIGDNAQSNVNSENTDLKKFKEDL